MRWRAWRRLPFYGAIVYLVCLVVCALFVEWIAPYDPSQQNILAAFSLPNATHWLGTDYLGRDILSRLMYGARLSLGVSIFGVALAVTIGLPIGLATGYFRGRIDTTLMWFVDMLFVLPPTLVAISFLAVFGTGLSNITLVAGLILSTRFARLTRSVTMVQRQETYVTSAIAIGSSKFRVLFRHILPNVLPPLLVQMMVMFGSIILIEAGISFLGLGTSADEPSWGRMLSESRLYFFSDPYQAIPAGVAISVTVLAFNLVADGLNQRLSPSKRFKHTIGYNPTHTNPPTDKIQKSGALLSVKNFSVGFPNQDGSVHPIIHNLSFQVNQGDIFGIVGPSGQGKSVLVRSVFRLLPQAKITEGQVWFDGVDISAASPKQLRQLLGNDVSIVFQNAKTALNPTIKVGQQIQDVLLQHQSSNRDQAYQQVIDMFELVQLSDPKRIYQMYPHQLSGGMAKRVQLARALICRPRLLIADELTSGLDLIMKAQIVELLLTLHQRFDMTIILISHDMDLVASICAQQLQMVPPSNISKE